MKRIAITSNTSWFIYNFFRSSISEFLSDGLEVVVIAPRDEYSSKLIEHGCFYQEIHLDRSGMNPFCEFTNFISLSRELKRANVDCVVNFTPKMNIYSTFAAKLLGKKVINNVAGLGSIFTDGGLKSLIGKALLKLTQPMADHTVFQNKDDYDLYIQNGYIHKDKASRVNGIGINLKQFQPVAAPDDGVIRFILVARLLKTKGVEIYARAARDIGLMKLEGQRIEFALLGFIDETHPQGIKLPEIQFWHNEGTLNFLGSTDHVESVVKDYDCVVLPSFYREGVPQCLIEAAAMAKPIITTDNVGCRETVNEGESGFLVRPKSKGELIDAIIKMSSITHEERLAMGKKGRKKAEQDFCHLKVAQHYISLIDRLTGLG